MTTPYDIARDCYHAGSMAQGGRTIHPGTVEKWAKEIEAYANQVSEERVREALDYIESNPDEYRKLMDKKKLAEGYARASLNKPQNTQTNGDLVGGVK